MSKATDNKKATLTAEQKRQLLTKALREKARKVKSNYPLSSGQQALWLLHQQAPQSSAYNIAVAARMHSNVDASKLHGVFKTLLTRHPSLRTTFSFENDQPVQVIHGYQDLAFEQIDASGDSDEALNNRVVEMYHRPFDLAKGPLMRVNLFTRSKNEHVLLLTIHHIVGDALSIWVLMSDFLSLYNQGDLANLPPAKWQYQDFVVWQSKLLASPEGDKLWDYWQQNLKGELPILNLPTDRQRPPVQSYNGASINFALPNELLHGLSEQAKSNGVTLYILLMAAFQVLLHRLSGQDDILVGSPTMGRNRSEFESIFGYFVNPIVLRAKFADNPSFIDFLQQVRSNVINGLAHQDYPFPELVKRLQPERDASRSPLFQVLFVMQKLEKDNVASLFLSSESDENTRIEQGELTLAPFKMGQQEGQFDLSLEMIESEQSLSGNLRYNTDLFDLQTAERFAGYFENILHAIVANPTQCVSDLTMLPALERQQLLVDWNNTAADYPNDLCIHQLIEAQVLKTPDATAVVCDQQQISYKELNTKANQLAHHLIDSLTLKGKGAEDENNDKDLLIGICVERSIDMVVGILAILKAGGAYVPIDPSYPAERLAYLLNDADMAVLISHSSLKDKLTAATSDGNANRSSNSNRKTLFVDEQAQVLAKASDENPQVDVKPSNLIYIIYTSGSTGQPKSVAVYHQGFVNLINWFVNTFEVTANDRALVVSPSSFDLTQKNIFAPLVKGGQLHLLPQTYYQPDLISNIVNEQKITWINCASSAFYPLIEENSPSDFSKLASMRYVFLGGEPISIKTLWPWLESTNCRAKVVNPYGPSECTDVCAAYITEQPEQYVDKSLPIGKPVDNAQLYILGKHLELLPIGVAGEIYIAGAGVGRGYLNSAQMTHDKFISNPFVANSTIYKTGDLARFLPDGNIEYLGRVDNQVKVRGFRIELGEIEAALGQHPQVDSAVAMVREDQPGKPRIVAYLIAKQDKTIEPEQLRAFLKAKLPEYMVPSAFVMLAEFPLSANGKTDLKALPSPRAKSKKSSLPQTELERQIAEIWQDVLDVDSVGIHDNFFELGGHSLLLVNLQSQLKKALSQSLTVVELFEHPTIHALAQHLTKAQATTAITARNVARVDDEIAIIGMAARLPGADDIDAYWQNLKNGVESVTFFSDDELLASGIDEQTFSQPNYVNASAVLSDIDAFDAAFFDISPKEAQMTDPQHRLFLECAWQAVENAGYAVGNDIDTRAGADASENEPAIGVFGGAALNTYLINNLAGNEALDDMVDIFKVMIGNSNDFITTRTSYKLNLNGPSVNVQTACSTSLVAVNMACDSLTKGDCDMALAGGVSARVPHKNGYLYQQGMILSPDGHCRAFDAQAKGIVGGNGVGIVVLKPLKKALKDGDNLLAVIKGSAINNDGALKMNFSAPSVVGQAKVINEAQAKAGVEPQSISYIETHGTGTELGDPIEIAALTKVFGPQNCANSSIAIGSVKSNIGHTDSAAGVASLIKTVLSLQHKQLPPSLHFENPNPQIDFDNSPFYVNSRLSDWQTEQGAPRRAGVSSFGIGGTNAHAILEQAPERKPSGPTRGWQLVVLSAKTPSALATASRNLAGHVESNFADSNLADLNLADIAYTLSKGRKAFDYRRVVVCQQASEVIALGSDNSEQQYSYAQDKPNLTFMFSGQGSQYVNMGVELYKTEPVFMQQVDFCAGYLKPLLGLDLREVLYVESPTDKHEQAINQTAITQAALFVTEYAMAKLWMSWGLVPQNMIGHSIGEYVAACLAQVFSVEDALTLVATRGQLMQSVKGDGAMLAVPMAEQDITPFLKNGLLKNGLLKNGLSLAAINTPNQCVVAGPSAQIHDLQAQLLESKQVECRRLHTSHAFHSEMMEPILAAFTAKVAQITLNPPKLPYLSNVTGDWISADEATDPNYWAKHLRQTVMFSAGITRLLDDSKSVLLEVGPGQTLTSLAKRHQGIDASNVMSSLRHPLDSSNDSEFLLKTLGKYWLAGGLVDWSAFYGDERRLRVPLPTYPFERKSHWVDPASKGIVDRGAAKKEAAKKEPAKSIQSALTPSMWPALVDASNAQAKTGEAFIQTYAAGQEALEQLSLAYINVSLQQLGAFACDSTLSAASVLADGNIDERYHQLVSHWFNLLAEQGQLTKAGDEYKDFIPIDDAKLEQQVEQAKQLWPEIKWVERLMNFGQNLAPMLTGEKEPLSLSFEGENVEVKVSQDDMPLISYFNTIISKNVHQAVQAIPSTSKLRVLELGAGMGLTTTALLPMLPPERTEYTFTDVGKFFLRRAEQQLGSDYPFMKFGELNVEQSPQSQGYASNSYDVIVATMMLHVVKDIKQTFEYARSLLAPGGVLLFLEGTQDLFDFEITDGLLMQTLNDGPRNQGNPFLTNPQWSEALKATGFNQVAAFPENDTIGYQVFVAQADSAVHSSIEVAVKPQAKETAMPVHAPNYIAPKTKAEKTIAEIWAQALGLETVGINDDFFELGGDSLLAIQLVAKLNHTFTVDLSLSQVIDAPTVAKLAAFVGQSQGSTSQPEASILVNLQPHGSQPPLFCIHPGGGAVFPFIKLAQYLGEDQPLYAIQSPALVGQEEFTSLAKRALHYIEAIKSVQSEGPYYITGMSFGGNMAVEIAIQMKKQGDEVGFVGMFDSYPPVSYQTQVDDHQKFLMGFLGIVQIMFNKQFTDICYDTLQNMSEQEQWQYILGQVDDPVTDGMYPQLSQQLFNVWKSQHTELKEHSSAQYSGPITLFQAIEKPPEQLNGLLKTNVDKRFIIEGWNQIAQDPIERVMVPGNHFTLLDEPHVQIFADLLKVMLKKAQVSLGNNKDLKGVSNS